VENAIWPTPFAKALQLDTAEDRKKHLILLFITMIRPFALLALFSSLLSALGTGKQLTGVYAPAVTPALSPEEARKKFVVPEGFEVRLFAAEPDVINPVAMAWDERGRLWVLELYEYPLGAATGTKPRDRIKILEDTDNDGRADKVTVFADGLNLATGLLPGNGGVYVGQAPDLLFLRDTNHDDLADTRETVLTGFGLDDRHELLNGFTWGPDGFMYLTHGVFTHSKVRIPEASAPGVEVTAAVARFDPRTKSFEVFADGTSNPWGVDFDAEGNAFVSACVIDHLFYMAPGGIYARQGGTPANPFSYQLLPSIVTHKHFRAAFCGICIYLGAQFPAEYRGRVLMGNIHQNAINQDVLKKNGSGFKAEAREDFLTTSDGWFRPVSEQVGPDGALWIADWCDKYPCYQNAQADPEGVDRERGRIWRVIYTGKKPNAVVPPRPRTDMDLGKATDSELVKLLSHPNEWQRRVAQRVLTEKLRSRSESEKAKIGAQLAGMVRGGGTVEARLAALCVLFSGDCWPADAAWEWLKDREPAVRGWTVRLAAEAACKSSAELKHDVLAHIETAAADASPTVRLAVATAIRRLVSRSMTVDQDVDTALPIGKALDAVSRASSDAKDPLIPFMVWMAGEPAFAAHPEGGLKWLADAGPETMPLAGILARKAMLRLVDTQDRRKLALTVDFLKEIAAKNADLAAAALDGIIEGQRAAPMPPERETETLFAQLRAANDSRLRERGQELGTLWGNAAAIRASLAAINDTTQPIDNRIKAIAVARTLKNRVARAALLEVIVPGAPTQLTTEAIRALGTIDGDAVADDLLGRWKSFDAKEKAAAADVLASRKRWAITLLSAIESKDVSGSELPISAIRTLADSNDDFIRQRARQSIGRIRPADADKRAVIAKKKEMILKGGPADPKAGHELAKKTCFVCHKLYGEGADVGPDLTGVGRSSLDALLANVIDPNQIVGKGYENVMVETKDGRSVSGRVAEDTPTHIRLLSAGPKSEVVAKSGIESMRVSELSVMPEGLEQMPDDDFRNLMLYILHPPQERGGK
jgi:putative membrane-bound dehydrogenase-like protein